MGVEQTPGSPSSSEQITAFSDQTAGWSTIVKGGHDATMDLAKVNDSDLGSFLSRPIRLKQLEWAVGTPLFDQFNPWGEFINSPRVREKTANFALYRSKLHVKAVISGTGFHYGRALVSYNPFAGKDDITVERNFLSVDLIQASQKPHFFLNPTNNEGGQLELPFFYPHNYFDLAEGDVRDMGEISIKSFDNLQHANSGNDPVTVTIYAWATDVVLSMPTSQTTPLLPQSGSLNSGDEYGKGIISKPASAVAHAAGLLKEVPLIAPYAKATEMVAKGVGTLATHWGYSRPPIVTDILLQKPSPLGNLTNTDAADAVQKLTLDSKQEITIDSRTTGLDGTDQMDISHIVQRESYLTSFSMSPSDSPDKLLWQCRVNPTLVGNLGEEIHPTPMAMMAQPFKYWSGSIKYRFQIVKSNFHKGRLLFRWDPNAHNADVEYNTVYSRVVDLAEESDFEVVIGWGQARPFQNVKFLHEPANNNYGSSTRFSADSTRSMNGILEVDVVNSLVSPALDSDISINVFVSACDDFKLGELRPNTVKRYTLFPTPAVALTPQSGVIEAAATGAVIDSTDAPVGADPLQTIADEAPAADHTFDVFFGETPKSLRDLFRRYVLHRQKVTAPSTADSLTMYALNDKGLGYFPGYDPVGIDINNGLPCNVTIPSLYHWFMPCYAGWRGATRTKYTFEGNIANQPTVARIGYSSAASTASKIIDTTDDAYLTRVLTSESGEDTLGGAASTNLGVNDTIEVETPFYNGTRFQPARMPNSDFVGGCHSNEVSYLSGPPTTAKVSAIEDQAIVRMWKSVGEDFSLFFFTGCPIVYNNAVVVAP